MHVPYGPYGAPAPQYPQQPQQQQQPQYQQQPQQYQPQPQPQQQPQSLPPQQGWSPQQWGQHLNVPRMPAAFGNVAGLGGIKTPSGLPAPLAFAMGIVAVVVALIFDVVFLHVHIPGVGGYAWYLTTALSFMAVGYGGMMWTRASKTTVFIAVGMAAILYGIADVGLGLALESLTMGGAIILGAQGMAIGFVTGFGGVYKAIRAKNDD